MTPHDPSRRRSDLGSDENLRRTIAARRPHEPFDDPSREGRANAAARPAGDDVRSDERDEADALRLRCARQAERIAELERDLHALSHSIRSPLVALKGFAGLLEEEIGEHPDGPGRHFVGRISEAGRRIEYRLDDLGELLALGETTPKPTWVEPAGVIESLTATFKPALDESGMRILVSKAPPPIFCDRDRLHRALTHLVGNALQHATPCEPRHVLIRVARLETEDRVSVEDAGPGLDPSLAERAFEPFECAGDRWRRFDGGRESTGVGLAVVRRIAEGHGGSAWLESGPGLGTRVHLTFPHG